MKHPRMLLILFLVLACTGTAYAQDETEDAAPAKPSTHFKPAILFEGDKKGDKAFVEMALKGAALAKTELHINYDEYTLAAADDREQTIRRIALSGATHIIAVGFENVVPVLRLAEAYPNIKFTVIDGMVPPVYPNVRSIVFKDNEGGFLVGMLAAMQTHTGTLGFVGGMDVPLIRNFALGYESGARLVRPDIKVIRGMIGTTRTAWQNPQRAETLAEEEIAQGADVIFACAGGSSLGVLKAAHAKGKLAIGIDANQDSIYPGTVLTSLLKRVDKAVYETLKAGNENRWEAGIRYMGVADGALDYTVDVNNQKLVTKDMVDKVENAKDMIIRGSLIVPSYSPQ